MKKTLFIVLLLPAIAYAQTGQGSFIIGGSGSLSFNKSNWDGSGESNSTNLSLSPAVSYFVVNNFSVGLSLPYGMSWYKTENESLPSETKGNGYSIAVAPIVRYYIPVKRFFIVTQATYGWWYSKDEYENFDPFTGAVVNTEEYSNKYRAFALSAGPAFFLNPYTSVEILANYRRADYDAANQSMFSVSVGFQIYLPSRME